MNAPFKTPTADLPLWDLSDLYVAKDDPGLKRDMEAARASVAEMNALAGTLVAARGEPAVLGERLDRAITL
ncbi:MAG: oligoendopeptidase F, partial [Brevundimonas sp.]|nr:oligoendopeptidase F [Brevundimonas sp.]